jgi:hypothetical protein
VDVIPYLKEVEHLKVNIVNGVIPSLLHNLNQQEFFVNGSLRQVTLKTAQFKTLEDMRDLLIIKCIDFKNKIKKNYPKLLEAALPTRILNLKKFST